jgi:hypothetical protein
VDTIGFFAAIRFSNYYETLTNKFISNKFVSSKSASKAISPALNLSKESSQQIEQ